MINFRSPELRKDYGRSESLDSVEGRETATALTKRKVSRANKKWQEDSSSTTSTTSEESSNDEAHLSVERWQCPPKSIWKPVLEVSF